MPVRFSSLRISIGILVLTCASFVTAGALPMPQSLSSEAKISIVTMGEGHEIYLAFGHAAFRVQDPVQGYDEVFNYGTFDLQDPGFIPKFVYGELNYALTHYSYADYLAYDKEIENRRWTEQVLDLDRQDTQALYAFLANNAKPENRYYLYDFIRDNCATRITDALSKVLGGKLVFDLGDSMNPHKTYREMLDDYVYDRPLYQFSFYLVLGMASDRQVGASAADWHPDYLQRKIAAASVVENGAARRLSFPAQNVYAPANPVASDYGEPWLNPAFVLWPLAALVVFFAVRNILAIRQNKARAVAALPIRLLDFLFFFVLGIMGLIVYYLNFLSIHTAVKENLNILWLWPTHVVAAFFFLAKKRAAWMGWYFVVAAVATLVPLIAWPVWPQKMIPTMIPLMLIVAIRAAWYFAQSKIAVKRQ